MKIIDNCYLSNKIIVSNSSYLSDKTFNKKRTNGFKKNNILYIKEKLLGKERIIELYFTKKSKQLYKITIKLNLKNKTKFKNFKKAISKKYNEIRNPLKKSIKNYLKLQVGSENFYAIDKNNSFIHLKSSVFNQNEISYINLNLFKQNEKEKEEKNKKEEKNINIDKF